MKLEIPLKAGAKFLISYDFFSPDWVPKRGVRGSERRKCVMAEEFVSGPKFVSTNQNS
jgi:hypothetical protein